LAAAITQMNGVAGYEGYSILFLITFEYELTARKQVALDLHH
jgi:hypothetical protein